VRSLTGWGSFDSLIFYEDHTFNLGIFFLECGWWVVGGVHFLDLCISIDVFRLLEFFDKLFVGVFPKIKNSFLTVPNLHCPLLCLLET